MHVYYIYYVTYKHIQNYVYIEYGGIFSVGIN